MSKDILTILIVTFITVIGWVGFDLFHAATDTTIPAEYANIKPISDEINTDVLDVIDARQSQELYNPFETLQ